MQRYSIEDQTVKLSFLLKKNSCFASFIIHLTGNYDHFTELEFGLW